MQKSFTAKRIFWKIMRWFGIQVAVVFMTSFMAIAHDNFGQILDREISITLENVPLDEAIERIESEAKIRIFYSIDHIEFKSKVSISAKSKTLKYILDKLLLPIRIEYTVFEKDETVTLRKMADDELKKVESLEAPSKSRLVTGVVKNLQNQPLPGVNIVVKGTSTGTATDANGSYTILVNDGDILIFSFIGFKTLESQINGQATLDVVLEEDVTALTEVVVNAGYYDVEERQQTGNISRVTAADISKQPVSNPLAALEGRMPGVQITQTTGVPGGGFTIQIRGQNSLRTDGNDPFYVVDGVPFTSTPLTSTAVSGSIIKEGNPLSAINPSDIESIEVLKDADATAIYGSRGANGVVLITTKRGKAGKSKLDINVRTGFGNVASKMKLLNTSQYLQMRHEAYANDVRIPTTTRAPDLLLWDTTRYTDWQKKLIGGTAKTTNAQISYSGGDTRTQFSFGGGYYRETTVFPGNFSFQRFSGNMNLNHTSFNGKFKAAVNANYSSSKNNLFAMDLTGMAVSLAPDAPALHLSDGSLNADWQSSTITNPLFNLRNTYHSTVDNLVANASLSYEIINGLRVKANLGYTTQQVNETATNPLSSIPPQLLFPGQTGSSNFGNGEIKTWIIEPQLDYLKKLGESQLNVLIGSTFQNSLQTGQTLAGYGYTSDALLENIQAATTINVIATNYSQYRYTAAFSRINYTVKEKYILNLTGRRDGSSRFGPGKQFGNFGALGAAWIFSNESFIKDNISFLTFGKLRSSYGITGSDAIGNYQYLNTFSPTSYPYNNTRGLISSRLNNPDYSWETNRKFELAADFGIIRDKIFISASWYSNRSSNQLVGLPLPLVTGQSSVQFNFPATVKNEGWEFQINTKNVNRGAFKWTTSFNISIPTSKLVRFPNIESFPVYNSQYQIGSSLYKRKTLKSTGVDPQTGLYTFKDTNGDDSYDTDNDGYFIKTVAQKFYGGFNNSFTYKQFQLDVFFQFVKQTGENYRTTFKTPGALSNQPTDVLKRWQQPGDVTSIQRFDSYTVNPYNNIPFSDAAISDASFIRLKNVSFSWQVPQVWTNKASMSSGRIYVQCQNLLTITKYLGLDPENKNTSYLPPLRVITLGCQLTF